MTSGEAMSAAMGGLGVDGTLMVLGAAESMQVSPLLLIARPARSIKGWYSGHVDRFAGHAGLQRADRRAVDERSLPAGARRRSLRPHDERQGAVSRRADDRGVDCGRRML